MASQLCARENCKAYAMHDNIYCHAHAPTANKTGGAPIQNSNARKHGLYSKYLSKEEQLLLNQSAGRAASADLEEEIEALRIHLARQLKSDGDPVRSALAIARLKQVQRQLTQEQATGIVEAINSILTELGLGEGSSNTDGG
jgi:hypothetical protein